MLYLLDFFKENKHWKINSKKLRKEIQIETKLLHVIRREK